MKAVLVLEDGTYFTGEAFGKHGETYGEVVFNTCMTGYQEITTDPSYNGQIVTMTYPLIGNYGFNDDDNESNKTHLDGFIVKELCDYSSNWRNNKSPENYFKENGIVGIQGIDTRALTQHIRSHGSMLGIISSESGNVDYLIEKLKEYKTQKRNLVMEVTAKHITKITGHKDNEICTVSNSFKTSASKFKVALLDLGVKQNIVRSLKKRNCEIYIFPADSTSLDLLAFNPDGILLSNGPGDPADLLDIITNVKNLIGKKPIMGICLGHQIIGLALGGKTYKLKFGHHGGNHPVKDLINEKCYITSQNHNYALADEFDDDIYISHINVNDKTVEGLKHKKHPIISVQFHPEAAPGPEDTAYIFDEFIKLMEGYNAEA